MAGMNKINVHQNKSPFPLIILAKAMSVNAQKNKAIINVK